MGSEFLAADVGLRDRSVAIREQAAATVAHALDKLTAGEQSIRREREENVGRFLAEGRVRVTGDYLESDLLYPVDGEYDRTVWIPESSFDPYAGGFADTKDVRSFEGPTEIEVLQFEEVGEGLSAPEELTGQFAMLFTIDGSKPYVGHLISGDDRKYYQQDYGYSGLQVL